MTYLPTFAESQYSSLHAVPTPVCGVNEIVGRLIEAARIARSSRYGLTLVIETEPGPVGKTETLRGILTDTLREEPGATVHPGDPATISLSMMQTAFYEDVLRRSRSPGEVAVYVSDGFWIAEPSLNSSIGLVTRMPAYCRDKIHVVRVIMRWELGNPRVPRISRN